MDLTTFLVKYGVRTTSNFQLRDIFTDLNINGKVLMRDELRMLPIPKTTKKQSIIMNLQTTKDEGSHWIALFRCKGLQYYFNPYGVLPTKEVYNYFGSSEKPLTYNKIQIQQYGME